jgi:two-component system, LytTR family, response regulator
MTLRAMVVDDEAIARRRVRRLLRGEADVEIVAECGDGASALQRIAALRPDLVLLDVHMPGVDGLSLVEQLPRDAAPAIIFITAFDRYALHAFDVQALDYLLKPFSPARFRQAVERARDHVRDRSRYLTRIAVRARGRIVLVDVDAIDWIEAADNYVTLHARGREHLLRDTLTSLERQLDPERFVRIHRSTIVRLDRIVELAPATHGDFEVRLADGATVTLSRTWRERVERALGRSL